MSEPNSRDWTRRSLLTTGGGAALAFSLRHLLDPSLAFAQPAPKRGGKIMHANCYFLNRAGESANGRNARYLPTFNTRVFWNCLTWINNEFGVEPELATAWVASPDQKVWEFTLREDVLFHDGRQMTSADVVASFKYHMTWAYYARLFVADVEPVGTFKVRFHLKEGDAQFPWVIAEYDHWIGPAKSVDDYRTDTSAIGTGPFRLVEVDNKRGMRGVRNETYWMKGLPYVDEYEMVLTSSQASLNGFRTGQFNVSTDFDPALAAQYEASGGTVSEVAGYQVAIPLDKEADGIFRDVRVRKALALAIDRQAINRIVYRAPNAPVANDSFISTADPNLLPWPGRDVALARRLLAEAGHPNGLKLPTLYYTSWYPEMNRVFPLIAQSIKEAGFELTVEERPADGFALWATNPQTNPGRFYATLSGNRHSAATVARFVRGQLRPDGWDGDGYARFTDVYARARLAADDGERKRLYHEMQRLFYEEVPHLVPVARRNMLVHKGDLRGVTAHIQHWSHRWETAWIG